MTSESPRDTVTASMPHASPNVIAYVDEAGHKGYARNLTATDDDNIGLMCGLLIRSDQIETIVARFQPGFDRFASAAPAGEKLHITDAFKPENVAWGEVAASVREEFLKLVEAENIIIVYDARRMRHERERHQVEADLMAAASVVSLK